LSSAKLISFFRKPIWKWAIVFYVFIEVLIQLNFYFKQYPDINIGHLLNSVLRVTLFMLFMAGTWLWCYYATQLARRYTVLLVILGFALYYLFSFIKNVYLLDYLSSDHPSYAVYLETVSFWEFFVADLAYSKDDILRYTILVSMFFGIDFFYKFRIAEEQRFALTLEKKQMEIDLMKWQLNPHFYFNTLNNLYGLAAMKSGRTEECILKLSDIMQYVIYECKEQRVDLEKEVLFLRSYVEIEKLRYEDITHISMEVEGNLRDHKIVPLILIQFIENGFKHGLVAKDSSCWLTIFIQVENGILDLNVKNSLPNEKPLTGSNIGMQTARNLLAAYYGKYELTGGETGPEYSLHLSIHLNSYLG
jgi:two-component system, LytTR family, sensor kinase